MPKHAFIFERNNNNKHVQYFLVCKALQKCLVIVIRDIKNTFYKHKNSLSF